MNDTMYTCNLFMNSVLPLFKEIAVAGGALEADRFVPEQVVQFSCQTEEELKAIHFVIANHEMTTVLGAHEAPTLELHFKTVEHFNAFFKNKTKKLPSIRGIKNFKLFVFTMKALLRMGGLLSMTKAPKKEEDKRLLCKLLFYLLTSGISQLNKLGHPDVRKWSEKSPRRVYALTVDGYEDVAAHVMIERGKSRSRRGRYLRSKPFYTMRFVDLDSALAVLQETGDTLTLTGEEKLIMEGAPEFGGKLGDLMMLVGSYVK